MRLTTRWNTVLLLLMTMSAAGCGGGSRQAQPSAPQEAAEEIVHQSNEEKVQASEPIPGRPPTPLPTPEAAAVPPPPEEVKKAASTVKVKGIYVSASNMKGEGYKRLVKLLHNTDLNAMVIDVKNDSGQVTYTSQVPLVKEIMADTKNLVPDMREKLKLLKEDHIYTIARIVTFKDPFLAGKKTEYALQKKGGGVWRDQKGISWVDPYNEQVWDYNLAIAEEAVSLGFDEIQFDYVRFPDNGKKVDQQVSFQNAKGYSKAENIRAFLQEAKKRLGNVPLSADVFGLTTSSKDDMGIGQKWEELSPVVDIISPMIYPSHYSKGMYKLSNPDMKPYATVDKALEDALAKNKLLENEEDGVQPARIRPWYQDFTATWVKPHLTYGNKEVKEQVRAGQENGIEEFLLWNPSGKYTYK